MKILFSTYRFKKCSLFFLFFSALTTHANDRFCENDEELGMRIIPNLQAKDVKVIEGKTIYNITYTTDSFSRRYTSIENKQGEKKKFAIFFGCSYIWGMGVKDDETIPYYFSQMNKNFHAYNYGIPASGPHHTLALLEKKKLNNEIPEINGLGIYWYNRGHISQVIGSANDIEWLKEGPYYYLDQQEHLQRKGSFLTGRPYITAFYRFLKWSKVLDIFHLDFPKLSQRDGQLTCTILEQIKNHFLQNFAQSQFLVVLTSLNFSPSYPDIKACLAKRHVDFLDLENKIWEKDPQEFVIQGDGHLNAKGNYYLAKIFTEAFFKSH